MPRNTFSSLILACKLYAALGNMFGVSAIVTMVVIGFDRYNVIVKGFSGAKINAGKVKEKLFMGTIKNDVILTYHWSIKFAYHLVN